jgi:antirestriction protein ArdC
VALWAQAVAKRYITGYWASYKQWQKLGAQERSGERGSTIIFYKDLVSDPGDQTNADADRPRFVIRSSHVFNAEQVDGWEFPQNPRASQVEIDERIDAFVRATKANILHGSHTACYRRQTDRIELPKPEQFVGTLTSTPTEAYYAVLLHELTHWTGAPHRLNRTFGARFGDRSYAFEELVAELGAAFLCSAFRIVNEPRPDHAAYISNWLDILDRDHKAIFTAASMAQTAVEYLRTLAVSNDGQLEPRV